MSFKLPDTLYSPDQLNQTQLDLQDLMSLVRGASARKNLSDIPQEPSPLVNDLLKINNTKLNDLVSIEIITANLQQIIKQAKTMHIILPAPPPTALKIKITNWARKNLSPLALITFSTRNDLGGGIAVQAGSNFYDLTFRRKVLQNKSRITEIAGV